MTEFPRIRSKGWQLGNHMRGGGQATAYHATHPQHPNRQFVIKILRPWTRASKGSSKEEQIKRFAEEVAIMKRLREEDCSGIVPVEDCDLNPPDGSQPWYAMPYYKLGSVCLFSGERVEGWAEDYRDNIKRVLDISAQVARVLHVMHSRTPPIVHRDVSTGNIFVAELDGRVLLGDFGIAYEKRADEPPLTGDKASFGPWRWRPPELLEGSRDQHNPKSDIFLLGGVIYELLTEGEHIDRPERPGGRFLHEERNFSLTKFSSDPRTALLNRLLRKMWADEPKKRLDAAAIVGLCESITNWRSGDAIPEPLSDEALAAAGLTNLVREQLRSLERQHQQPEFARALELLFSNPFEDLETYTQVFGRSGSVSRQTADDARRLVKYFLRDIEQTRFNNRLEDDEVFTEDLPYQLYITKQGEVGKLLQVEFDLLTQTDTWDSYHAHSDSVWWAEQCARRFREHVLQRSVRQK